MKILVIRFSSFGDVTQCLSVVGALAARFPGAEIHWVTREDFQPLIAGHPSLRKVWAVRRRDGFRGLIRLAMALRDMRFDRIYDAHNNLRSRLLCSLLRAPLAPERLFSPPLFVRRSAKRWKRFLLFRFRINRFEMPFSGQRDLLEPLAVWDVPREAPPAPQIFIDDLSHKQARDILGAFSGDYVACAPSAAHALKRWPLEHWRSLILAMPGQKFVLLGGPEDAFLAELAVVAPERVLNLAGRCSLAVSAAVVDGARVLVTNDTGLLHVAEQRGRAAIALMGPAPFGFPSRPSTRILQLDLSCRPCSKHGQGPCVNPEFQKCLAGISPSTVVSQLRALLGGPA